MISPNLSPRNPANQPFVLALAVGHAGQPQTRNLERRRRDYSLMIAQNKIGDGHRDVNAYHRPGSNKK